MWVMRRLLLPPGKEWRSLESKGSHMPVPGPISRMVPAMPRYSSASPPSSSLTGSPPFPFSFAPTGLTASTTRPFTMEPSSRGATRTMLVSRTLGPAEDQKVPNQADWRAEGWRRVVRLWVRRRWRIVGGRWDRDWAMKSQGSRRNQNISIGGAMVRG